MSNRMIQVKDVETIRKYLVEMFAGRRGELEGRLSQHARHLCGTVLALVGHVLWRADPGSIEINPYFVNSVWFTVDGLRYCLVFSAKYDRCVHLRERNRLGRELAVIDDTWTPARMYAVFAGLGRPHKLPIAA